MTRNPHDPNILHTAAPIYHVIDAMTGKVVGRYANRNRAVAHADKRDARHGAYRYQVVTVFITADDLAGCDGLEEQAFPGIGGD